MGQKIGESPMPKQRFRKKIGDSPIVHPIFSIFLCSVNYKLIFMKSLKIKNMETKQLNELTINISSAEELKYWCKRLHCDKKVLTKSVNAVGTSALMVDLFLELNRWKCNCII